MSNQNLWAPWRMEYINQLEPTPVSGPGAGPGSAPATAATATKASPPASGASGDRGCFLCDAARCTTAALAGDAAADATAKSRLILLSDPRGLILLNRFPYTTGHLLIACPQHVGDLTDLTPQGRADLIELTALAERVVRLAFNPQGINIGINLGRCAGAGLPGHLHLHVVPRWNGDANFLSVIGQVRVIPQALEESYRLLADALRRVLR